MLVNWSVTDGSVIFERITSNIDGKVSINWNLGASKFQSLNIELFEADGTTHIYGSPIHVNATTTLPTLIDMDGNEYSTARIGKQVWMRENLRVTKFSDGTPIPLLEDTDAWANLRPSEKAYCYYNNSTNNDVRYGILYTWAAAMNGEEYSTKNLSGVQGVCPTGWHMPSYDEFYQLRNKLGGRDVAGGKMKENGTNNWFSPNEGATNDSRFTALPGGIRYYDGSFHAIGNYAYFWSTTENCLPCAPASWWLFHEYSGFYHGGATSPNSGVSVRCLKDMK